MVVVLFLLLLLLVIIVVVVHVVVVNSRNLPLKFGQDLVSNSRDINGVEFPVVVVLV